MLERVLSASQLLELVDELASSRQIVGPVKRYDHHFYERVDRTSMLDLDFKYCVYSPKAVLFPAHETLFAFQRSGGGVRHQVGL